MKSPKKKPSRTKDLLRDLDVRPSKERGQNFLIRQDVPESIANFGAVPPDSHVVEIGPGTGSLTQFLVHNKHLTLIEIEPKFCTLLRERYPEVQIVNADVRTVDFSTLGTNLYVYGNIPYVFSTDIVFTLIKNRASVKQAVLMVQREFAERLAAPPGGRDYGSISVSVQLWCDVELGPIVPGDAFHPPTQVSSRVMKLSFLDAPRVAIADPMHFEKVVRAAFAQRRKKVINSLLSRGYWSRSEIDGALNRAGISAGIRPEQLSIAEFARMAEELSPSTLSSLRAEGGS